MQFSTRTKLINAAANAATLAGAAERAKHLGRPLERLGHHMVRKTTRILETGERGIHARHRSGLSGSMTYRSMFNSLVVGGNIYSRIHNEGGVVLPSKTFLAIPIADNLKAGGDPRYVSPLLVSDGFFFEGRNGGLYFGRKLTKRAANRRRNARGKAAQSLLRNAANTQDIELLFVLKRQVVMPERKFCTFDPADREVANGYISDWVMNGR